MKLMQVTLWYLFTAAYDSHMNAQIHVWYVCVTVEKHSIKKVKYRAVAILTLILMCGFHIPH